MVDNEKCVWRIYYADGDTFSDKDGFYWEAPSRGVLVIVQRDDEVGRSFWSDCDYYWWEPEYRQWVGGDMAGLLDYLGRCSKASVLQGRIVPDKLYRATRLRALQDPDFPRKSAKYPREQLDGQTI